MKCNVGTTDKVVRVILALVFLYMAYSISWWFVILTVILFVTVITGFCPPYKWLGISTCEKK